MKVPVFAVEGHPNEGKSTVLSTLAEDDSVRVSPTPGETVECREFPVTIDAEEVLRFVDTPGFQNPTATLEWFEEKVAPGVNLARAFREAHAGDAEFRHECELLAPIAEGAGIIYVVDGSRPVGRSDRAEMEILRLTTNPRMAVINSKNQTPDYSADWREAARKYFNSVRVFNAHTATYTDRIALLETLRGIEQEWEPALQRTIDAYRQDWARRLGKTADAICDYLAACVTHEVSRNIVESTDAERTIRELRPAYEKDIAKRERELQGRIKKIFKHTRFERDLGEASILAEDLFSEKTWQALGLTRNQLAATAAISGAVMGGIVDAHFGGATFLLGTLFGGLAGGAMAWFGGESVAAARVKGIPLGGKRVTVGPNRNPNFLFILLDRALIYHSHAINWAHGRRDDPASASPADEGKQGFTTSWSSERRKVCARFLKAMHKGGVEEREKARRAMAAMLREALGEIGS